jgi:hypothetical protein
MIPSNGREITGKNEAADRSRGFRTCTFRWEAGVPLKTFENRMFESERTGMYSQRVLGGTPASQRIPIGSHKTITTRPPRHGPLPSETRTSPSMGALGSGILLRSTGSVHGLVTRTPSAIAPALLYLLHPCSRVLEGLRRRVSISRLEKRRFLKSGSQFTAAICTSGASSTSRATITSM